jgi:hypothetical protein
MSSFIVFLLQMVKILVGTGVSWEGDGAFPSLANFHLWGAHGPSLKVFYACFIFVFLHCRTMFGREPMFTKFLLSSQTAIHTIKKLKIIISYEMWGKFQGTCIPSYFSCL